MLGEAGAADGHSYHGFTGVTGITEVMDVPVTGEVGVMRVRYREQGIMATGVISKVGTAVSGLGKVAGRLCHRWLMTFASQCHGCTVP